MPEMTDPLADWPGFKPLRYTQVPDEVFDILLAPGLLTEGELRCLWYIIRHTFGWKKDSDAISLTQFTDGIIKADGTRLDWGAGVTRKTAIRALHGLEAKGIILARRSRAANKENAVTVYGLRMDEGQEHHDPTVVAPQHYPSGITPPPVVAPQHPQETRTTDIEQEEVLPPELAAQRRRILAAHHPSADELEARRRRG